MSLLFLDFETRSIADLKKCGADVYARHPSTEILCTGFAVDDGKVQIAVPGENYFATAYAPGGQTIVSHNAAFELAIWNQVGVKRYGWQPIAPEQMICTMAACYAMALPGALADAAPAAGLSIQKDTVGHRIMMQVSQPRKVHEGQCLMCGGDACEYCYGTGDHFEWLTPANAPEKFKALHSYCAQDVEVERQLFKRLMPLSKAEQELWVLDQEINQRGVQFDLKSVKVGIEMLEGEKKRYNERMRDITKGAVATVTATGQLTDWLKLKGVECEAVAKADVIDMLAGELPEDCRQALELRQEAGKSSTAKLAAMLNGACEDGRLRGMFQFNGAGATGRFAGRRVQFQNMKRPDISDFAIEHILKILNEMGS